MCADEAKLCTSAALIKLRSCLWPGVVARPSEPIVARCRAAAPTDWRAAGPAALAPCAARTCAPNTRLPELISIHIIALISTFVGDTIITHARQLFKTNTTLVAT